MNRRWKSTVQQLWHRVRTADHGRRLRVLAGVDEKVLDAVPHDRARYTGVGGVVLSTSVIAGLSMTFALSQVLGGFNPLVLVPALVWAVVVLNLDRWLVTSSTGTRWGRRTVTLVPRLLVAVLLGVVIAEPVVLRVFESAIEQHVNDERDRQVRDLVDELVRCNPVPGGPEPVGPPVDCAGKVFSIAIDPTAIARELAETERQAAELAASIRGDSDRLAELENLARLECTGAVGPGLTGVPGEGEDCRRLRREADAFRASHPIEPRNAELDRLNAQVNELRHRASTVQSDYQLARDAEIQRQRAELEANQQEIGLLERFQALHELTAQNSFLWSASWMVRGLFIVLDCLPVLVKLLGGTTAYDRLLETRTASHERVHAELVRSTEEAVVGELELRAHEKRLEQQKRRTRLDLDMRKHDAGISQELNETIATVAARIDLGATEPANGQRVPGV